MFMDEGVQIVLLAVGGIVLVGAAALNLALIVKLMADVEKFGRLLRKLRREVKGDAANE